MLNKLLQTIKIGLIPFQLTKEIKEKLGLFREAHFLYYVPLENVIRLN